LRREAWWSSLQSTTLGYCRLAAGKLCAFLFSEQKTLAHSLVDGAFRAFFGGIVVAVAGLYILGAVEASIDRQKKRAALQELTNTTLSQTLTAFSASYLELHCARDENDMLKPECQTRLDAMINLLQVRRDLLEALMPDIQLSSIPSMIDVATQMRDIPLGEKPQVNRSDLSLEFSKRFRYMVGDVAQHFN